MDWGTLVGGFFILCLDMRKNSPQLTEQDIIDRANKLRKLLGGQPLPNKVAKEIIAIAKVAPSGKVGKFHKMTPVKTRKPQERVPTEHEEQCKVIQWCDQHPIAKHIFAIPNGSHKSPAAAAKFKREGLRSGVPDLFLPVRRGTFCGLFVEMKRTKGSVTSREQVEWTRFLNTDYCVRVCKGADEAIATIKEYLSVGNIS